MSVRHAHPQPLATRRPPACPVFFKRDPVTLERIATASRFPSRAGPAARHVPADDNAGGAHRRPIAPIERWGRPLSILNGDLLRCCGRLDGCPLHRQPGVHAVPRRDCRGDGRGYGPHQELFRQADAGEIVARILREAEDAIARRRARTRPRSPAVWSPGKHR